MVCFENLKVGSRVQTNKDGQIFKGTVRYKGGLNTREGNWVGVELDEPGAYIKLIRISKFLLYLKTETKPNQLGFDYDPLTHNFLNSK